MIISVVALWNLAHRSLPCSITLIPFGATDSAVVRYSVTSVPVSGIVTLVTSVREGKCLCKGGENISGGEGNGEGRQRLQTLQQL